MIDSISKNFSWTQPLDIKHCFQHWLANKNHDEINVLGKNDWIKIGFWSRKAMCEKHWGIVFFLSNNVSIIYQ